MSDKFSIRVVMYERIIKMEVSLTIGSEMEIEGQLHTNAML